MGCREREQRTSYGRTSIGHGRCRDWLFMPRRCEGISIGVWYSFVRPAPLIGRGPVKIAYAVAAVQSNGFLEVVAQPLERSAKQK